MASNRYVIPLSERAEYYKAVQRANRRIKANIEYMRKNGIVTQPAQRSLVSDYSDVDNWNSEKTPLSRRVTFNSEREYNQYLRRVLEWGAPDNPRSVENVKESYIKAIIRSLTTSAIDNNIPLENNKLPGNIANKIRGLTLDQLTHFFDMDDPVADMDYLPYSEIDFNGVDRDGFVKNVDSIINSLKDVFPNKNKRAHRILTGMGIDSKTALQKIFPRATARQISYYDRTGNIPAEYKAPRKRKKAKKVTETIANNNK